MAISDVLILEPKAKMKYREALAIAMAEAVEDPSTLLIGQGVTDFKGIWGTTTGLPKKFPKRVIETPLSEDGITAPQCRVVRCF